MPSVMLRSTVRGKVRGFESNFIHKGIWLGQDGIVHKTEEP
jgi:hypothetical protein